MIKFFPCHFLGVSHRFPGKNKNTVYRLQISALVLEIFKFEKCVKYTNEMFDDVIYSTRQFYIKYLLSRSSYLGQFAVLTIETWQANSSTGNTCTAVKNYVPMATCSFPVPTLFIQYVSDFQVAKH